MPALKGLDSALELTRYAQSLKQTHGFDFVLRYYSHTASKNLSLGEAQALSAAGLQIGVVWETAATHASFFSRAQGLSDGSAALLCAQTVIGQPAASCIYFAVDYDATEADIDGCISDYFGGIVAAFAASQGARYAIGVYGSGLSCSTLVEKGFASMSWLSQSTGFAGSKAYAQSQAWNLSQGMPQRLTMDDGFVLSFDPDSSNADRPAGLFTL